MKELDFLKIIKSKLSDPSYLGDDCAYLKDFNICVSQDSLIENVHFSLLTTTPYELAIKSIAINVSDICASGAKPLYALISLSGKLNDKFINEFYEGIKYSENLYGIKIIGGDLTGADVLCISVCILADTKNRNISSRSNAKKGYKIGICGQSGSSAKGFQLLQKGVKKPKELIEAHLLPYAKTQASCEASNKIKTPYAMMDTSDGLFDSLIKIATASKVDIEIDYKKIPKIIEEKELVLFGGEDYSLVISAKKDEYEKLDSFIEIGEVVENSKAPCVIIDSKKYYQDELEKSYNHFRE